MSALSGFSLYPTKQLDNVRTIFEYVDAEYSPMY